MKPLYMFKRFNFLSLFFTISALMASTSYFAVKEYVTNVNDSGTGSLRDLIQNAGAGDTIVIDVSGVLTVNSPIGVNKDLTIIGPGPIHFKIDYSPLSGAGPAAIEPAGNALIKIEGIGFINGTNGHAINANSGYSGVCDVYGCAFEDNELTAINVDGGSINLVSCSFINNGYVFGQAAFIEANSKFINCTFYHNANGAVWVNNGVTEIINCTIYENGGTTSSSNAISVYDGSLTLRNNIIFNDTQSNLLIDLLNTGSINSLGGNITNDQTTVGTWAGTDIQSMSVNAGLSNGSMVVDGWGITYFPPAFGSDGIDIDVNPTNLPLMDQRRVWRVMDAGAGNLFADAGAVEYTPLVVNNLTPNSPGAFDFAMINTYPYLVGKTAFIFEFSGAGPFNVPGSFTPYDLNQDSTLVNGFSQNGSMISGPGSVVGAISSGYLPIQIDNYYGSGNSAIEVSGSGTIIAGISIGGFNGSYAAGIKITGSNNQISGCHLGVNSLGSVNYGNKYGLIIEGNTSQAFVGSGSYCGHNWHANRNVISSNSNAQIRIKSQAYMKISNNIIGLDGVGLAQPSGTSNPSDTGIVVSMYYGIPGSGILIGGADVRERNVIGDQSIGIELSSNSNMVINNFIGSDYTGMNVGATTSNEYGIEIIDPNWSGYVQNNWIGDVDKGNVVVGSFYDGIVLSGDVNLTNVFANYVGVGVDGLTPLGNGYSGIYVTGSSVYDNQVGAPGKGNIIGDNGDGISLQNSSNHTIVRSNLIGVGKDTVTDVGNGYDGIYVSGGSSFNMIGGCLPGDGNIIGMNDYGIVFEGGGANYDTVYGNYIGITPIGTGVGNATAGLSFWGAINDITVGDVSLGCANEVAYNGVGLSSDGIGNQGMHISGNSFHDNSGYGIDLDDDGTVSDSFSTAPSDNNGAYAPQILNAVNCGGSSVNVEVMMDEDAEVILEFFKAADGEEGDSLITQAVASFLAGDPQIFTIGNVVPGTNIVVTAIHDVGSGYLNTSEFSTAFVVTDLPALTPSISHSQVCLGGNTYPLLTVPSSVAGTPVWYWNDGGTPVRLEWGDTINSPEDHLFASNPGTYDYYVVDSISGCHGTPSSYVTLDIIAPPTVTISGPSSMCYGDSIQLSVNTVTGATYLWEVFNGGDPFTILGANNNSNVWLDDKSEPSNYTDSLIVHVDSLGCIMRDTMALTLLFAPYVDYDSVIQPVTCGGFGEIYLATWEPSTSLTVYYNTGTSVTATTSSDPEGMFPLTGLLAGTYDIDSISNGSCTDIVGLTITLADPAPPTVDAGLDQIICEGNTATLSATPTGGSTYSYSWDNSGGATQTVVVSPSITTNYTVTLTDDVTGCQATDMVLVTVNPIPVISIVAPPVICDGDFYTYDATVSGVSPFVYTWTSASEFTDNTVEDASTVVLLPGTYTHTLNVTDLNGCTNSEVATLTINPTPNEGNPFTTNVTCFGGTDGSIMLAPVGSYSFNWTGPSGYSSVLQDISGLAAGTYNLVMTDADGCVGNYSTSVTEPPSLPDFTYTSVNLICNGDASGSLLFGSETGTSPFTYSIDNGGSFVASGTFSGLSAGTYDLLITDALGCVSNSQFVTLTEPTSLIAVASVTSNYNGAQISCPGNSDGELTGTGSGGTGTMNYSWEQSGFPVGSSAILTGINAGTYDLIITDGNGCSASTSISISDPTMISIDNIITTNPSCNGSSDGVLEAVLTLGTSGFDYIDWYDDPYTTWVSSDNPFSGVSAGTYYIEAVDLNGCVTQGGSVVLTEPSPLTISIVTTDETCSGYGDGVLDTLSVTGGTTPYSLSWIKVVGNSTVGSVSPMTGLSVGDYVGVITDANSCQVRDTVTINVGESYTPLISYTYTDTCLGTNSFDFVDGNGGPLSGGSSYSWVFTNGAPGTSTLPNPTGVNFTWTGLQQIIYQVTSGAGCVFADTTYSPMIADSVSVVLTPQDISCFGAADGIVTATGSGGFGSYDYYFNSSLNASNVISGLTAGTYDCYIVDQASGCQSSLQTIGIAEPTQITFTATISDATCGQDNGTVDFQNVTGGDGNYTYSIDGSSFGTSNPISGITPGTYQFYVQDGSGCIEAQNSNTISNQGNPVPTPSISPAVSAYICADGSGNYGYLYAISNDVTTGTFSWGGGSIFNGVGTQDSLLMDDNIISYQYVYLVESNGTCVSAPDSVLMDVVTSDVVDNTILEACLGSEVILDLSTSGTVIWINGNGEIADTSSAITTVLPSVIPSTYVYEVSIDDCIFTDSVMLIEDTDCDGVTIVNNAFSPNGDGVNDLFIIDASALLSNSNKVTIINRWGDIINEYDNYDNFSIAWDGTNKSGDPVPSGTYFYVVEIQDLGFKSTGWIQVVR
ncbi:MAG: gliding motility-associated C-terminal domain-containing protein [Flavobacteriales bacterium]|nr:gliding motility-associated C-terminal domain-containing protein [Flavobacteriales bacterium]